MTDVANERLADAARPGAATPSRQPGRSTADLPLVQLTLVRYREFFREPEAVFWVFIFPVLLAAGLGLAFRNRPPEVLTVAVTAGSPRSDELAQAIRRDSGLAVDVLDDSAAARALRTGKVALIARPAGESGVDYRYDDSSPEGRTARLLVNQAVQRAAGRADPVGIQDNHVREPGSRYIDFVIPGLLGMNLMGSGIWGLGFAIVDARKKKLLKRLVATPMQRWQYLMSFLLSRLTLLLIEVATLVGFGALVFHVPTRGSLIQLGLICLLASLAFSSLGLLISSRARTMEGASGLMNLVMLPMWILSGVFFSAQRFPSALQPFIRALPLTAVIDALRANMLQGAGFTQIGAELAIVAAWLVGTFVLALKLFRWR